MSQLSPAPSLATRRLVLVVSALGFAQIISWGSFYYSIAVLGESMSRELGIGSSLLFGAFTFSLLVSGMAAPTVGRLIDRHGGRRVLCCGSLIAALAAGSWASAQGPISLFFACFLCGITMAICLYEAAFITLNQLAGERYRSAITALTLYGGLASTVFWPLSQWLLGLVGWRNTLYLYAGMQLLICLPLHWMVLPSAAPRSHAQHAPEQMPASASGPRYLWLATGFAIGSFVLSVLSVHIIGLFKDAGLSAAQAVLIASLIGPMQVLVRVLEFVFARRAGPLMVGTASFYLMVCATVTLYFVDGYSLLPFAVAILYGFSNGSFTIVRGIVPAALFGREGYGALLGRLARPAFVARAMAPFAFSVTLSLGLKRSEAILLLAACSVLAGLGYLRAIRPDPAQ